MPRCARPVGTGEDADIPGTIIEKQGTTLTVSPQGQLDAYSSPVLEKELQPYLDQAEEIIMDFTNVEYTGKPDQ